jgi:hypothetical protein
MDSTHTKIHISLKIYCPLPLLYLYLTFKRFFDSNIICHFIKCHDSQSNSFEGLYFNRIFSLLLPYLFFTAIIFFFYPN